MRAVSLAYSPPAALHSVPEATKRGGRADRLEAAAQDYEASFLSTMLKQMFPEIDTKSPFFGGTAEENWRGLLIEEYGKSLARAGGVGIADAVYRDMVRIQEGAQQ